MSDDLLNIGKQTAMGIIILAVVYVLGLQLSGLSLEQNVSQVYVDFYSGMIPLSLFSVFAMAVFKVRYFDVISDYLSNTVKFLIVAGWVILIAMISFSGQQVVPVPRASTESLQIGAGEELYLSTVPPAILEDLNYLVGLPMFVAVLILATMEFGLGVEAGAGLTIGVMIVAALIAAIGYNIWVIPGFASAHVPSYGSTNPGLFMAAFFSFGQSLVYMTTGWFVPLAHAIHNMIVFIGRSTAYNIGPFAITGAS